MNEFTHDPFEYIRQFQQLLISDKKKIAFLFGAGTSLARKNENSLFIPAIGQLTEEVENELTESKYKNAIDEIKEEIGKDKYNIETLLSNLEQKQLVLGNETLNGLDKDDISALIKEMKNIIREKVSIHKKITNDCKQLENLIHCDFAEWIGTASRKYPIEIFTTNYDYLFELGLESKDIPYYDGFTGSYEPFFNSESVEDPHFLPFQTKLWKIHGSLGWHFDEELKRVTRKNSDSDNLLIYPSILKYDDSKKQPYISFLDRLNYFLKQDDAILITCGYSFGDEHINERIMSALNANKSSHVFALYYDIVWNGNNKEYILKKDSNLAKLAKRNSKISVYGCRSAIINCKYGDWKLGAEPDEDTLNINLYFDEDAADAEEEINVEKKGKEVWSGKGELILPNFCKYVTFLRSMSADNYLNLENNK